MSAKTYSRAALAHYTGSVQMYRHPLVKGVVYTEGVQYVADAAGAYWLIDAVATSQLLPAVKAEVFQHWRLAVDLAKQTARLTCDDGNGRIVHTQEIEFTDFPDDEVRFYFTNGTLLLPSEY